MTQLVHLAPEKLRKRIQRSGLRGQAWSLSASNGSHELHEAIFGMAVLPEFHLTHQWMRELRRWRGGRFVAVHLSMPADRLVYVGRYGQEHELLELGLAVQRVRQEPAGAQVVFDGAIAPRFIKGIRDVRQDVGWVETPETRSAYDCVCQACIPRGTPNAIRRFRGSFLRNVDKLHTSRDTDLRRDAISSMELAAERAAEKLPVERVLSVASDPDPELRARLCSLLRLFPRRAVEGTLWKLSFDSDQDVRQAAIEGLARATDSVRVVELLQEKAAIEDLVYLADALGYTDGKAEEALVLLGRHPHALVQGAARKALQEWRED